MIKGTTSTGFKFNVHENLDQDARVAWYVGKTTDEDENVKMSAYCKLMALICGGEDVYVDLMEHVAKHNKGFCDSALLEKEIAEIVAASKPLKN